MLGRVMAVNSTFTGTTSNLGQFETGTVAALIGAGAAMAACTSVESGGSFVAAPCDVDHTCETQSDGGASEAGPDAPSN